MAYRKILYATSFLIVLASCSTSTGQDKATHSLSPGETGEDLSDIGLAISLNKTALSYGDTPAIDISLVNKGKKIRKILFDKPASTSWPWGISVIIKDAKTNKQVSEYQHKELLRSSRLYSEDELKTSYYTLQPGKSIHQEYALSDLIVLDNEDNLLPRGNYEIRISKTCYNKRCDLILSNSVEFSVK